MQMALFWGKTPFGIRIAAMKVESEAADSLKVCELELREAKHPVCCVQPSLGGWAGTN